MDERQARDNKHSRAQCVRPKNPAQMPVGAPPRQAAFGSACKPRGCTKNSANECFLCSTQLCKYYLNISCHIPLTLRHCVYSDTMELSIFVAHCCILTHLGHNTFELLALPVKTTMPHDADYDLIFLKTALLKRSRILIMQLGLIKA